MKTLPRDSAKNKILQSNENFIRWFSTSKIVDQEGLPTVVYHGTISTDISVFRPSEYGTYGDGIYFSIDPDVASFWAGDRERDGMDFEFGGSVYPVFIRLTNPASEQLASEMESIHGNKTSEKLKELGYDGVLTDDGEIVVFNPNQVKSALSNTGLFSLGCEDITDGFAVANVTLAISAGKARAFAAQISGDSSQNVDPSIRGRRP